MVIAGSGGVPGTRGGPPRTACRWVETVAPSACAMEKVDMELGLSSTLVGEAGQADAEKRARGCARPIRLVGSTSLVDRATGEVRPVYSSSSELDGIYRA
jgi:hypothetical protein